jgi:hypothetical protein
VRVGHRDVAGAPADDRGELALVPPCAISEDGALRNTARSLMSTDIFISDLWSR